ncbi:MAG: 3-keto-5-aminohexanoate cleavage protein [Rhodospirillales bacterium]|jgi:uncharacterized protein (DUF849 family)|nr:3-keto-5-aminohexanoate cleavage protein [Rhodospirillales bacterium]
MPRSVIISCALTGGADTTGINPAVPVTPAQIADEARAAYNAGAAVVHIHVRDPATGKSTEDFEMRRMLFGEVVEDIRKSACPVVLNLSTGGGSLLSFQEDKPELAAEGSRIQPPLDRVKHILELKPEICSLDVATHNMGDGAMVNSRAMLSSMAEMMASVGAKPEIEVFDTGHVRLANHLIAKGHLKDPKPLYQLCLGIAWTAEASAQSMLTMRDLLPENALWSAFGISRHQFPMAAQSVLLGGNVRVGLEDNLYISQGQLASGNAQLVERAVQIIEAIGEKVASVEETRAILNLGG